MRMFVAAILFSAPLPLAVAAQDSVVVLEDEENISVTGKITEVENDSFTIKVNNTEMEVTIDDMKVDVSDLGFLEVGQVVNVQGEIKDTNLGGPVIEADEIFLAGTTIDDDIDTYNKINNPAAVVIEQGK